MELQMGNKIALYRKNKGYTQEQLGEMVGVSGQAVSKWEKGGLPDTYLLPAIARALGISVDALFACEGKSSSPPRKKCWMRCTASACKGTRRMGSNLT